MHAASGLTTDWIGPATIILLWGLGVVAVAALVIAVVVAIIIGTYRGAKNAAENRKEQQ